VGRPVPVISTTDGGAMFELSSGYIIKDYDESNGRLTFTIDDNATIAVKPITISMQVSVIGSVTIKSQNYFYHKQTKKCSKTVMSTKANSTLRHNNQKTSKFKVRHLKHIN
jgi:hypothetical protein